MKTRISRSRSSAYERRHENVTGPRCVAKSLWSSLRSLSPLRARPTQPGRATALAPEQPTPLEGLGETGQIDRPTDEDGKEAREVALRELREESGYELAPGGELIALGDFFSSPGFTDEHEFLFAAKPVRRSPDGHAHDESETIHKCREFSLAEIERMIADNTIRDANTLSAWARLVARKIIVPT